MVFDVWDLGGGEGDDFDFWVILVGDVEVVEVVFIGFEDCNLVYLVFFLCLG